MDVELDIINAMIAAIGSSSITSTLGRHPSLLRAAPILARTNRTIQARGHWFNTEKALSLSPSADKEFILPQNTLKCDTTNSRLPYVRRGIQMYDPINHTFAIDEDKMEVDIVVQLDYQDLPIVAEDLIRTTAIYGLVLNSDADQIAIQARLKDMKLAKSEFERERLSQSDYTLRSNPSYARIMAGAYYRGATASPNRIGG